jgi:nucleoside phosphorylase
VLVSFGLAGALVGGLAPGTLVVGTRVVDESGRVLWEGHPPALAGARPAVVCGAAQIVDTAEERAALARASGAEVVDLESGRLAESGHLVAVVRAISDTPARPAGRLAQAAGPAGGTAWATVAGALLRAPRETVRTGLAGRAALRVLEAAAAELASPRTP